MDELLDSGRSSIELSIPDDGTTIDDLAAADTEVGELLDSGDEHTLDQLRREGPSRRIAVPSAPQAVESEPEVAAGPGEGGSEQPQIDDLDLGVPWDEPPTLLSRGRRWAVSLLFGGALAVVAIVVMRPAEQAELAVAGVTELVLTVVAPDGGAGDRAGGDGTKNTDGAQDQAASTSIGTGGAAGAKQGSHPKTRPPRGSGGSSSSHAGGAGGATEEQGGSAPAASASADAGRGLEWFGGRH